MTARQGASSDGPVPAACMLTTAGLAAQRGRWERLAARALTGRAETAGGLRLSFRPGAGTEAGLRRLAAVENQCCRWATWTVQASAGHLVLDIRATGDGIATLHGMFTGRYPAPPAHRRRAEPPAPPDM